MLLELLNKYPIFIPYIAIISIVAIVITIKDKIFAKLDKIRTPERTLLLISALGGSVAMLITMLLIRHKTKHIKFMLGIPVILILQIVAVYYLNSVGVLM
jgi:uncharacterized membrane protein YsdA (DUF1294 family)